MKVLYKVYSRYLLWKKQFKKGYHQYRYGHQLTFAKDIDLDPSVQFQFQTSNCRLSLGDGVIIRGSCNFLLTENAQIKIGKNVFFNRLCSLNAMHLIEIGDNTIFGEGVKIYDHNHLFRDREVLVKDQGYKKAPIEIGKNCWIGSNCIILPGVQIGDNVVIGAGTLVNKSIPSNTLVVGKRDLYQESLSKS